MNKVQVRICLDIGDDCNTWVTVVPVNRSYPNRTYGIALAAAEAAVGLTQSVMREAETVVEQLVKTEQD